MTWNMELYITIKDLLTSQDIQTYSLQNYINDLY